MKLTREGKKFVFATLLIAVAALNTGNNLIYLVFGMMLAILMLSALILFINLRGLSLNVSLKGPAFVNRNTLVVIRIKNTKHLFPSYSLRIIFPEGMESDSSIPYLPHADTVETEAEVVFRKRGVYKLSGFRVESGFPFIFLTGNVRKKTVADVVVYPEIKELDFMISGLGEDYRTMSSRPGSSEEILFIREFRFGDDLKRINWKASAKASKLMLKEYAREEPNMLTVMLDNINPSNKEHFEKAVSFAASAVHKFIGDGYYTRLMTCKEISSFGDSIEHLEDLLYMLAVVDEVDTWECPHTDEMSGATLLVLKSGDSGVKWLSSKCDMVFNADNF